MFVFVNCYHNWICDVILFIYNSWIVVICRLLVVFIKKLFGSSDTKCSSDIIFSFSSTRAMLFLTFLFYENKVCIFFLKFLLSETFLDLFCQNMFCAPFDITYYNNFFVCYISLKSLVFSFLNTIFLSMIFS